MKYGLQTQFLGNSAKSISRTNKQTQSNMNLWQQGEGAYQKQAASITIIVQSTTILWNEIEQQQEQHANQSMHAKSHRARHRHRTRPQAFPPGSCSKHPNAPRTVTLSGMAATVAIETSMFSSIKLPFSHRCNRMSLAACRRIISAC